MIKKTNNISFCADLRIKGDTSNISPRMNKALCEYATGIGNESDTIEINIQRASKNKLVSNNLSEENGYGTKIKKDHAVIDMKVIVDGKLANYSTRYVHNEANAILAYLKELKNLIK